MLFHLINLAPQTIHAGHDPSFVNEKLCDNAKDDLKKWQQFG
jgi:hypothetical protein